MNNMLVEETTGMVRNLMAPLKLSDEKKAMYVSKMVDEIFLEAYTALSKENNMEVDLGGLDVMEVTAEQIEELMAPKFEFDEILKALAFSTKILTLRYLEQAQYAPDDLYGVTKKFSQVVKE